MTHNSNVEAWVSAWGDFLFRYALSRVQDRDIAADLVQETFLAAWKGRHSFKGEASRKTWLTGILKHKITDHIRQQIRRRKLEMALDDDPVSPWFQDDHSWREPQQAWHDSPDRLAHDRDFRLTLESCLHRLPARQRFVFILREINGDSTEDVCKQCDISTTNLHVLMHRARLALRHCLQSHGFGASS